MVGVTPPIIGEKMNRSLKAKIIELFGTQADFAQRLGIDDSVVSRVVKGRKKLSSEVEKKWARVLKCAQDDLFAGRSK